MYYKFQFFCRDFLWRDTGCFREKFALCEIEECVDFEGENKEVSNDAIDFQGNDMKNDFLASILTSQVLDQAV